MNARRLTLAVLATVFGVLVFASASALAAAPEAPETGKAVAVTATTATLEGGVLNPGATEPIQPGEYYYFFRASATECEGERYAPEPPRIALGLPKEAVEPPVALTELQPNAKYTFCLFERNSVGETSPASTPGHFTTPPAPPAIDSEGASGATSTAATLEALVNPNNQATTACEFQYGTTIAYGSEAPCEPGSIEGFGDQRMSVSVSGLEAGTAYHFRVVAENASHEKTEGADHSFTTVPAASTDPVTAITGTAATFNGHLTLNSVDTQYFFEYKVGNECNGEAVTAVEDAGSGAGGTASLSTAVTGLLPHTKYAACLVAFNAYGREVGSPVTFTTLAVAPTVAEEFVTGVSSGSATLHGVVSPGGADTTYRFEYGPTTSYGKALSGDAGRGLEGVAVSVHPVDLAPGTLYHYRLVAGNEVNKEVAGPDQTLTTQAVAGTLALPDGRMWEMVSPLNKNGTEVSNIKTDLGGVFQAAEDGEAVTYITSAPISAKARSNPWEPQVLSMRDPDGWRSEDISTPHDRASIYEFGEAGSGNGPFRTDEVEEYFAFSPDLSRAYVQPEAHTPLVPGQPAPKIEKGTYNYGYVRDNTTGTYSITPLQPWEWSAEQVGRVQAPPSCNAGTSPAKGVEVDAVSRDGCYVYFNSESILAPGATGTDPLYVSHYSGGGWTTTFISSLSGTGAPEWPGKDVEHESGGKYVELSPNGRYVAFMSNLSLTGFDNRDANSDQPDEEVYLYDAASNRLVCPSCNRNGARPTGHFDNGEHSGFSNEVLVDSNAMWAGQWLAGVLPEWQIVNPNPLEAIYQPRYLLDDGRLFFDSSDALVPQDVNGLEDVYEYEPEGVGSCASATGCVSLISAGTSDRESAFVDASTTGGDAFFITRSGLIPQDHDKSFDIYNAHVCTVNVPCRPVPVSPPACETSDSCKAPPTPQPGAFGAPASATFAGAGNIVPSASGPPVKRRAAKCPGSRRRSHRRCVKRSRIKHKPAKGGK